MSRIYVLDGQTVRTIEGDLPEHYRAYSWAKIDSGRNGYVREQNLRNGWTARDTWTPHGGQYILVDRWGEHFHRNVTVYEMLSIPEHALDCPNWRANDERARTEKEMHDLKFQVARRDDKIEELEAQVNDVVHRANDEKERASIFMCLLINVMDAIECGNGEQLLPYLKMYKSIREMDVQTGDENEEDE